MASVNVEITGDARKLEQTFEKVNQGQQKVETGFDNVAKAGKESARQIESANEAAANKGAASYNRILTELKKQGPEGRAQAKKLEEYLQAAGKGGRKSIGEITDELKEIDPAAAEAATAADNSFAKFSASAVSKIGALAAGFLSVQGAVGSVNEFLKTQEALIDSAREKQLALASAQQESAKALIAYGALERDKMLQQSVPEIMRQTGFQDPNQVSLALGVAASSGATPEQALSAVTASARMTRLTPQDLQPMSVGTVSLMGSTGLEDARQAAALLQTTGTAAKLTSASQLTKTLPAALGAAVASVPGQERETASRQAAALFAQVTQGGQDTEGSTSAEFTIDFTSRMSKFFGELETQRVNARSEMETLSRKKDPLEKDLVRMEELRALIPALESATDPGTLFGRIEALQQSPELRQQFVGAGFGNSRFRPLLSDIFTPGSDTAQGLTSRFDSIRADSAFFESEAVAQTGMTPQIRNAHARSSVDAAINAQEAFDTGSATLGNIRQITTDVLAKTNPGGFAGYMDQLTDKLTIPFTNIGFDINRGLLGGSDAANEGVSAIQRMQGSRRGFARDGIDSSEAAKMATLDSAIATVESLVAGQAASGVFDAATIEAAAGRARAGAVVEGQIERQAGFRGDPESQRVAQENREVLERLATLMEKQLEQMQQTATNTRPRPQQPDPAETIRASAASADARAPR